MSNRYSLEERARDREAKLKWLTTENRFISVGDYDFNVSSIEYVKYSKGKTEGDHIFTICTKRGEKFDVVVEGDDDFCDFRDMIYHPYAE